MSSSERPTDISTWRLVPDRCIVTIRAHATRHAVQSTIHGLDGTLGGALDSLEETARGTIQVPVHQQDFGSRLRNVAMRRHLDITQWPEARFQLNRMTVHSESPWTVDVQGTIFYRGHTHRLTAHATGTLSDTELHTHATFRLPLRAVGVRPPKLLWLRVTETVDVEVQIVAKGTS